VVTRAVTELAEIALDQALGHARTALNELHGTPLASSAVPGAEPQVAQLWVIGMGKLGAREL